MYATWKQSLKINNDRTMCQELEINMKSISCNAFRGTLTELEAKYFIYKESIKLDLTNFDGVRFDYKDRPILTFKLKTALNVDKLQLTQHFEFSRKSSRERRTHIDIITCKIGGLRQLVKPTQPPWEVLLLIMKQTGKSGRM
jgi:hypothetical protein